MYNVNDTHKKKTLILDTHMSFVPTLTLSLGRQIGIFIFWMIMY